MADNIVYGLGGRLKALRKKHNMTQKDVASKLEVEANSVSRYENDDLTPSISNLIKLAIMYNTTTDYLLGLNKESFLYLHDFTESQRAYILKCISGLYETFNITAGE